MRFDRFRLCFSGLLVATVAVSACSNPGTDTGKINQALLTDLCQEFADELSKLTAQDAIPALTDPLMVAPDDPALGYLKPTDRVIGLEVLGDYLALPLNIFWWHEIINFRFGLTATFCPLTGSSIVFLRDNADGAELGVSGLLFKNNLVMYDRPSGDTQRTLWPQMTGGARCGPAEGRTLRTYPAIEMEWAAWRALHPDTRVVSSETGHIRDYAIYPYGDYDEEDNDFTIIDQVIADTRRLPKERVLGIPSGVAGGRAYPFGALRELGDLAVIHETVDVAGSQDAIVVFWDNTASAAMMFRPQAGGQNLTFEVVNGAFVDVETGSQWSIDGQALSGPLAGSSLNMVAEAYVSFWFAFSTFFPDVDLWLP